MIIPLLFWMSQQMQRSYDESQMIQLQNQQQQIIQQQEEIKDHFWQEQLQRQQDEREERSVFPKLGFPNLED
jgi:hypothetical protein